MVVSVGEEEVCSVYAGIVKGVASDDCSIEVITCSIGYICHARINGVVETSKRVGIDSLRSCYAVKSVDN